MTLVAEGAPLGPRRRRWTWTLFSAVAITIGALLTPVAILANWTQLELSSTDDFVATFAPLSQDAAVQDYLAAQTSAVIVRKVNVDGLTSRLVDEAKSLGLPPSADAAIDALGGLAAQSAKDAILTSVAKFVRSPAFSSAFATALRLTHAQLVATLGGSANAVVSLENGTVSLQLGPIVAAAKTALIAQGLTIAEAIPAVNASVVLVRSTGLATARRLYPIVLAIGTWLPLVVLAVLAGGVLLAKRRRTALIVAGAAVGVVAILTLIAVDLGKIVTVAQFAALLIPAGVAEALFGQLTDFTRHMAAAVAFIAIIVALAAWLGRSTGVPARLRAAGTALADAVRAAGDLHGLGTGAFGLWLHRWKRIIRWAVVIAAVVGVLFIRPLTADVLLALTVLPLLVLGLIELLRRPTAAPLSESSAS